MRIVRFRDDQGLIRYGIDRGDGTAQLLARSPLEAPETLPELTNQVVPIAQRLAPLVPVNIFCIGLNYREHARETGAAIPEQPILFMKPTTALNDPEAAICIPACCTHGEEVDYEGELAVVIGRPGRNIVPEDALNHVLGYTCANDVSARRWQRHAGGGQWIRGKGFDTFCPLGPVLVTADEIPDPQNLALTTTLNGQVMQQGHTSDMIFSVAQLIA
ncbi:MAG TPA: fumarylacetoacetate hydrolase family protein, partial [Phycisphaeraceae bacterium]